MTASPNFQGLVDLQNRLINHLESDFSKCYLNNPLKSSQIALLLTSWKI